MATVLPLKGQSNYDVCLKAYGSLDKIIQLCRDNNISDINVVEKKVYQYKESEIVDVSIAGYDYISGTN